MGLGMPEALMNTLARVDTPNMSAFVRSVVQGNALGVSMGVVMRNLAVDMRVRRRQQAEERAHKAPVKMLFPLIFLMFPALGVVILGPAMFEITEKLGGRGEVSGLEAWTRSRTAGRAGRRSRSGPRRSSSARRCARARAPLLALESLLTEGAAGTPRIARRGRAAALGRRGRAGRGARGPVVVQGLARRRPTAAPTEASSPRRNRLLHALFPADLRADRGAGGEAGDRRRAREPRRDADREDVDRTLFAVRTRLEALAARGEISLPRRRRLLRPSAARDLGRGRARPLGTAPAA